MDTVETIRRLLAHDLWANHRVNEALRADSTPRARELFAHLIAAQDLWMDRVEAKPPATSAAGDPSLDDFGPALERAHARCLTKLDGSSEDDLARVVEYSDLGGNVHTTPLRDILLHLVNHGTHHRAQIASALKQAGAKPPRIDFIVFAREHQELS